MGEEARCGNRTVLIISIKLHASLFCVAARPCITFEYERLRAIIRSTPSASAFLLASLLVLPASCRVLIAMRLRRSLARCVFLLLLQWRPAMPAIGIRFDNVQTAYTVVSVALGLILVRRRLAHALPTFRSVCGRHDRWRRWVSL